MLADADMQSADWRTAAIAGIIGVGLGLWWADSVAAIAIALDVVNDGRKHIAQAVSDLADHVLGRWTAAVRTRAPTRSATPSGRCPGSSASTCSSAPRAMS